MAQTDQDRDGWMLRHSQPVRLSVLLFATILLFCTDCQAAAQDKSATPSDPNFQRKADRLFEVILRRPREGSAFNLLYNHYNEADRLTLLRDRIDKATSLPKTKANALIMRALLAKKNGKIRSAIGYLKNSAQLKPAFYSEFLLGSLLVEIQEFAEAEKWLLSARKKNPPALDFGDLLKRLGRVQMHLEHMDDALNTWNQLANQFPRDEAIAEDVATLLEAAGKYDEALDHWKKLSQRKNISPFYRIQARLRLTELLQRLNRSSEAFEELKATLDATRPGSWISKDVHRRIADHFLKSGNLTGYLEFCRKRISAAPTDIQARMQYAEALEKDKKQDSALRVLKETVTLLPKNREISMRYLKALEKMNFDDDALVFARRLLERFPADDEILANGGRIELQKDSSNPKLQRRAIEVWARIADIRPDDPQKALRVAELCRNAAGIARREKSPGRRIKGFEALIEAAEQYYRIAQTRSVDIPQYTEYLGEFLHSIGRSLDAKMEWENIVEGYKDPSAGWHRLAEVYSRFGYSKDALAASARSVELSPKKLEYLYFRLRLLVELDKHEDVAELAELAIQEADTDAETEKILTTLADSYRRQRRVKLELKRLEEDSRAEKTKAWQEWLLAKLHDLRWDHAASIKALERALELNPKNTIVRRQLGDAFERAGDLQKAVTIYRSLADKELIQISNFEKIIQIQLEQGKPLDAVATADELVRRAPARPQAHMAKADVLFQLDRTSEALAILGNATDRFPNDLELRQSFAEALRSNGKLEQARDHYWWCFLNTQSPSEKLSMLTAIHTMLKPPQVPTHLLDPIREWRSKEGNTKLGSLCLAHVLEQSKEWKAARTEYTRMLAAEPNDISILQGLVRTSEKTNDWESAARYQQQIAAVSGDVRYLHQLVHFHTMGGRNKEAADVRAQIIDESPDPSYAVQLIEGMLREGHFDAAIRDLGTALRRFPDSWELRLRLAYAHLGKKDRIRALQEVETLLKIPTVVNAEPTRLSTQPQGSPQNINLSAGAIAAGSTIPINSYPPVMHEIGVSRRALSRLNYLEGAQVRYPRGSGRIVARRPSRHYSLQRPDTPYQALIEGMTVSFVLAQRINRFDPILDEATKQAKGKENLERALLSALVAMNQWQLARPRLENRFQQNADDAFSHVCALSFDGKNLFRRKTYGERKQIANELKTSFTWIRKNVPKSTSFLLPTLLSNLLTLERKDDALVIVAKLIDSTKQISDLGSLPEYAFSFDAPEVVKGLLRKVGELPDEPGKLQREVVQKVLLYFAMVIPQEDRLLEEQTLADLHIVLKKYLRSLHPEKQPHITVIARSTRVQSTVVRKAALEMATIQSLYTQVRLNGIQSGQLSRISTLYRNLSTRYRIVVQQRTREQNAMEFPVPSTNLSVEMLVVAEALADQWQGRALDLANALVVEAADAEGNLRLRTLFFASAMLWRLDQYQTTVDALAPIIDDANVSQKEKLQLIHALILAGRSKESWDALKKVQKQIDKAQLLKLRKEILRRL